MPIYVVADVEVDGPIPGENSMLCLGSVAVGEDGRILEEFSVSIKPLRDAVADPATIEWFQKFPAAWQALNTDPQEPVDAIQSFVRWVKSLDGEPIFVAHPLAMDGPWVDLYMRRFARIRLLKGPWTGERLFYDGCLCLRSFASGRLGWPLRECTVENYESSWLGGLTHTHHALEDARAYANFLCYLLGQKP